MMRLFDFVMKVQNTKKGSGKQKHLTLKWKQAVNSVYLQFVNTLKSTLTYHYESLNLVAPDCTN